MATGARWLAGGATAMLLGGLLTASLTAGRSDEPEARLRAFVAAVERERAAEPALRERAPLLEPAHGGDAMVFYRFAAARLGAPSRDGDLWQNPAFASASDAGLSALEPVLAALRMGALARTCSSAPLDLSAAWRLRSLLRCAWKRAAVRGEWRSVAELWLTEQAFALDALEPYFVQSVFLGDWTQAGFAALDTDSARVLAAGLAQLDARWPRSLPTRRYLAQVANHELGAVREPSVHARLAAWRTGFDPERRACDELVRLRDSLHSLADTDVAWPARAAQWEELLAPPMARDSASASFVASWRDTEQRLRRDLASLRIVRAALAFRFGHELPVLADPFADAPLQVRIDGDVATFRSAAGPQVLELRAQRR